MFNTPPLAPTQHFQEAPSWPAAIVWRVSLEGLSCATNCHGMRDRLVHEHGRQDRDKAALAPYPEWRFSGFFGQVRVVLEDGTPWLVTVLAPSHFVRQLMTYPLAFEPTRP